MNTTLSHLNSTRTRSMEGLLLAVRAPAEVHDVLFLPGITIEAISNHQNGALTREAYAISVLTLMQEDLLLYLQNPGNSLPARLEESGDMQSSGLYFASPDQLVNGFQIVPVRLFFDNRYWKDLDYKENLNQYGLKIFLSSRVTLTLRFRWCPKRFGICVSFEPI